MAQTQHTTAQLAAMSQASAHVDNASQAITGFRGQVADIVAGTTAGYVTDAANVFRGVMDQWHSDLGVIIQGLETIRGNLTGTSANYQGAMDADSHSANQIAALLNGGGA